MAIAFVPSDQMRAVYYDIVKPQFRDVSAKLTSLRDSLRDVFE
jgi:hypothetical protein